jgi:hypothetical protein
MDDFRRPELLNLYDQNDIDGHFYKSLANDVSACAEQQQGSVAHALQKQKEQEKMEEEDKEARRKKIESAKKSNDAINDALKMHSERLASQNPILADVVDYMALMRFTPMVMELLHSTSGSTFLTPADIVKAMKMMHPGLVNIDDNIKWEEIEGTFEVLTKCDTTKSMARVVRLARLAEHGAPTIPKLQDYQKKRPAEEEAEGSTSAKKLR